MESLRWILIAVGIVFILLIYFLGKKRRQRDFLSSNEYEIGADSDTDLDMGLPEFSAHSLDDVDEGVGEVRVVSGGSAYDDGIYDEGMDDQNSYTGSANTLEDSDELLSKKTSNSEMENSADKENQTNNDLNDIIVIYILPKANAVLQGAQINSAAQALGLSFGEMDIFHYVNDGKSIFSLANMLEPGSFNAETMHDLKTTGLTLFMQIKGDDPMDDLTEMLQRSYQIAGLLEARLCNGKREPLTEQDAENYRSQVRAFLA